MDFWVWDISSGKFLDTLEISLLVGTVARFSLIIWLLSKWYMKICFRWYLSILEEMLGRSAYCGVIVEVNNFLLIRFIFAYTIVLLATEYYFTIVTMFILIVLAIYIL